MTTSPCLGTACEVAGGSAVLVGVVVGGAVGVAAAGRQLRARLMYKEFTKGVTSLYSACEHGPGPQSFGGAPDGMVGKGQPVSTFDFQGYGVERFIWMDEVDACI
jgi:hypothetical protein